MAKSISIDTHAFDGIKQAFDNLKYTISSYFSSITKFQQYAYMALAVGILFIIVSLIMW
jgi:hypothetical protein